MTDGQTDGQTDHTTVTYGAIAGNSDAFKFYRRRLKCCTNRERYRPQHDISALQCAYVHASLSKAQIPTLRLVVDLLDNKAYNNRYGIVNLLHAFNFCRLVAAAVIARKKWDDGRASKGSEEGLAPTPVIGVRDVTPGKLLKIYVQICTLWCIWGMKYAKCTT